MKWLYRILRLFFCPHNYREVSTQQMRHTQLGTIVGSITIKECKHCGKMKQFRHGLGVL